MAVFAEFMKALGVEGWINSDLPKPGSGRGYNALEPGICKGVEPHALWGWQCHRGFEGDKGRRWPGEADWVDGSTLQLCDRGLAEENGWWRECGRVQLVNKELIQEIIKRDSRQRYTLMVDPFVVEAEKHEARMTYLGVKGYRPVVATLRELGVVIAHRFKEGNDNSGRVEILKESFKNIPPGKGIGFVVLDAEYYSHEVMEYLNSQGVSWAVGADKDAAICEAIKAIPEGDWRALRDRDGVLTGRQVASTVHTTNKGKDAFRLVVIRWRDAQLELFDKGCHYHVTATNIPWSEEEVVWEYTRANIENHIKEL